MVNARGGDQDFSTTGVDCTSIFDTERYATNTTIAAKKMSATVPSPTPRPPTACDLPIQSEKDAPMGRVRTYAIQKAPTPFSNGFS